MSIFHSTEFKELRTILKDRVLRPMPIRENTLLESLGVKGVWLSKNLYKSNNVFGQYSFEFCYTALVKGRIVALGEINGSETFLSVDEPFANHIALVLNSNLVERDSFFSKEKEKANLIIGCHIPLSVAYNIEICSSWSDRNGDHQNISSRDCALAMGRLVALVILDQTTCLDRIFCAEPLKYAKALLYSLVGYFEIFNKRCRTATEADTFHDAISLLLAGNYDSARDRAACIGGVSDVAGRVIELFECRFNEKLELCEVMSEYCSG